MLCLQCSDGQHSYGQHCMDRQYNATQESTMNANGVMSLNANVLGVTFALNCVTTRIVVTIPTICGMLLILIDFTHCTVQCDVQCAMCTLLCQM